MSTAPVPPDGGNPTDNDEAARQILDLLAEVGWVLHGWNDAGSLPRQVARRCAAFAAGRAAATPDPPDMTNMCEGESPDHKPGITPAASPDERLREALAIIGKIPQEQLARIMESVRAEAAADREAPDEAEGQKITHGRHCTCTPCAVEDWTNPAFAPCGMHGKDCPQEYQPLGPAGSFTPPADEPKETTT